MNQKIASFVILILLFSCFANAQRRQSDSMRIVQEKYWKSLKDKEQHNKDLAAIQQQKKAAETVVVTYDSRGNKIETSTKNGEKIITKTISVSPPILNRPFSLDTINKDSVSIIVFKSRHRMQIYHKGKAFTAYKCVFGANNVGQKFQEGDRKTPEGTFKILDIKKHDTWELFMLLDYPNEQSQKIFDDAKINGLIPSNARIGGAIGIHGIWKNGDNVIDLKHNWTDGCISLKNKDIMQLSTIILPGITTIKIVK